MRFLIILILIIFHITIVHSVIATCQIEQTFFNNDCHIVCNKSAIYKGPILGNTVTFRSFSVKSVSNKNILVWFGLDRQGHSIANGTLSGKDLQFVVSKRSSQIESLLVCRLDNYGKVPNTTLIATGFIYLVVSYEIGIVAFASTLYGIISGLCIILFIVLCVFAKKQPLRSRGVIPFFMTIFFIIKFPVMLGTQIGMISSSDVDQPCLVFIEMAISQFLYLGAFANHARYLINLRIIKNQTDYRKTQSKSKFVVFWIRVLKLTASYWFFFIIFSILFVLLLTPTIGVTVWACDSNGMVVLWGILLLQILGTLAFYFIIYAIDFFIHCKMICKERNLKRLMITKDPLYFRVEYVLYFAGPILLLPSFLLISLLTFSYDGTARSVNVANLSDLLNYILPIVLLPPALYYLAISTMFPLIVTIWQARRKKVVTHDELATILADDSVKDLFQSFCKAEFSGENLDCWEDIQEFKKDPSEVKAMELHSTYLVPNAPIEVNIPQSHAKEVLVKIQSGDVTVELFVGIERDCCQNMYDTFSRFAFSDQYVQLKKKDEEIKKI